MIQQRTSFEHDNKKQLMVSTNITDYNIITSNVFTSLIFIFYVCTSTELLIHTKNEILFV